MVQKKWYLCRKLINMKISFLIIICLLIFGSCTKHYQSEDEENIISVTDQFASNYFNFKLKEAIPLCTPESENG